MVDLVMEASLGEPLRVSLRLATVASEDSSSLLVVPPGRVEAERRVCVSTSSQVEKHLGFANPRPNKNQSSARRK